MGSGMLGGPGAQRWKRNRATNNLNENGKTAA